MPIGVEMARGTDRLGCIIIDERGGEVHIIAWWKDVDVKAFFGSNITQFCLNIIDNLYSRIEHHLKLIHLSRNISAILKAAASPVLHAPCVVAHPFPVASPAK